MNSNYEKIGKFVEYYDEINSNEEFSNLDDLQGINSNKYFQECKSNKNDIELNRYRICRNHTFAYNKATSRNGEKISIAYREDGDCLISPSYITFKISDKERIIPKYLMLCFSKELFDSYSRFNSWGSATEFLNWEDFCDMEIKVPTIPEQKEIIKKYEIIEKRIEVLSNENNLLNQICTLQLSKFNNYVESCNSTKYITIRELVSSNESNYSKKDKFDEIIYLDTGSITENYVSDYQYFNTKEEKIPSRCKRKVVDGSMIFSTVRPNNKHYGMIYNPKENFLVSTGFSVFVPTQKEISIELVYMWLTSDEVLSKLNEIAEVSVTTYPSVSNDDILNVSIEVPTEFNYENINKILRRVMKRISRNNDEIRLLNKLKFNYINKF